jgi:4-azaleucine resistance transporter AzlC
MHVVSSPVFHHPRLRRLAHGAVLGLPVFLGYLPIGMAFGILARNAGFSVAQAVLCSALALSGAGQFVGLSLVVSGADLLAILITTGIINLRYVLFGATLSPWMRRMTMPTQAALAFFVTDETFAVDVNDLRGGSASATSMLGVGVVSWAGWVGGTLVGAVASGLIGDPTTWGVDFAMAAMFTALLVAMATDARQWAVAGISAALALLLMLVTPGKWFIIIASVGAAAIGAAVWRDEPTDLPGETLLDERGAAR